MLQLVLGGTFDPIHLGHIHIASEVAKRAAVDSVRIIPCNQSSLRAQPIASAEHRLAMVNLAAREFPFLRVDAREIMRGGVSYMVDTLRSLRDEIGQDSALCLILGIDAVADFTNWHDWQEIMRLAHLIAVNRPGYLIAPHNELKSLIDKHGTHQVDDLRKDAAGRILFLEIEPIPISATMVRAMLKMHEDVSEFLPKIVAEYIKQNDLYL